MSTQLLENIMKLWEKIIWIVVGRSVLFKLWLREMYYRVRYQGSGNIPIDKIKKLVVVRKLNGHQVEFSKRWVRDKLQEEQLREDFEGDVINSVFITDLKQPTLDVKRTKQGD